MLLRGAPGGLVGYDTRVGLEYALLSREVASNQIIGGKIGEKSLICLEWCKSITS